MSDNQKANGDTTVRNSQFVKEMLRRWLRDGDPHELTLWLARHGLLDAAVAGPKLGDGGQALRLFLESLEGVPCYDVPSRALLWQGVEVAVVARHERAKAAILIAFEAQRWPGEIDDPLDGESGGDPDESLRQTVKCLNDGLAPGTLRFFVPRGGRAVRWETVG